MSRFTVAVLAAVSAFLVLMGSAATAQSNQKTSGGITNVVTNVDKRFMTKAAEGNIAEVMTGELALKKSKNERVRTIAQMLIKDHSQGLTDLKQVASKNGFPLPNAPNARQKAVYNRLSRLSGAAFDKAFLAVQVKAHVDTITLFQMETSSGRDGEAVLYAREYLPGIQHHTSMIVDAAQDMGVRVPASARAYAKERRAGGRTR